MLKRLGQDDPANRSEFVAHLDRPPPTLPAADVQIEHLFARFVELDEPGPNSMMRLSDCRFSAKVTTTGTRIRSRLRA